MNARSCSRQKRSSVTASYLLRKCRHYMAGSCKLGSLCRFAHGVDQLRKIPDFRFTSMCCINSSFCRKIPDFRFTSMCYNAARGIPCPYRDKCTYAHSEAELVKARDALASDDPESALASLGNARLRSSNINATGFNEQRTQQQQQMQPNQVLRKGREGNSATGSLKDETQSKIQAQTPGTQKQTQELEADNRDRPDNTKSPASKKPPLSNSTESGGETEGTAPLSNPATERESKWRHQNANPTSLPRAPVPCPVVTKGVSRSPQLPPGSAWASRPPKIFIETDDGFPPLSPSLKSGGKIRLPADTTGSVTATPSGNSSAEEGGSKIIPEDKEPGGFGAEEEAHSAEKHATTEQAGSRLVNRASSFPLQPPTSKAPNAAEEEEEREQEEEERKRDSFEGSRERVRGAESHEGVEKEKSHFRLSSSPENGPSRDRDRDRDRDREGRVNTRDRQKRHERGQNGNARGGANGGVQPPSRFARGGDGRRERPPADNQMDNHSGCHFNPNDPHNLPPDFLPFFPPPYFGAWPYPPNLSGPPGNFPPPVDPTAYFAALARSGYPPHMLPPPHVQVPPFAFPPYCYPWPGHGGAGPSSQGPDGAPIRPPWAPPFPLPDGHSQGQTQGPGGHHWPAFRSQQGPCPGEDRERDRDRDKRRGQQQQQQQKRERVPAHTCTPLTPLEMEGVKIPSYPLPTDAVDDSPAAAATTAHGSSTNDETSPGAMRRVNSDSLDAADRRTGAPAYLGPCSPLCSLPLDKLHNSLHTDSQASASFGSSSSSSSSPWAFDLQAFAGIREGAEKRLSGTEEVNALTSATTAETEAAIEVEDETAAGPSEALTVEPWKFLMSMSDIFDKPQQPPTASVLPPLQGSGGGDAAGEGAGFLMLSLEKLFSEGAMDMNVLEELGPVHE
uniref:C3H1-type domain-containing protein n=1 Tax=Chromera velia CCMP2878 TaxID=1169474 RepID=A0A0G4HT03_9ALVE|eukprot:Cvel_8338.t1-p1 / transcript=Cvel_8338.t1 / gene=Cvel_8338 / organism=Chromera_velia_CCMP2878 / gene_product=hypothetical protein / transcript_product=hypothetical protein / location=Cvel_scaffold459:3970-8752(-) / protein_length=901 / sequence_SO=supercontig / SO=protein_coding / is_pseudo=false